MRILLVKTSSLGDVIHNLPVVRDLLAQRPDCVIDWVVERALAEIPRLHPGVRRVIPVGLRAWRQRLLEGSTWREIAEFGQELRAESYDLVIDTQGLLKSALVARRARGPRCGYDAGSAREPAASRFYDRRYPVPRALHAVERNRRLVAAAAGYAPEGAPDYGLGAVPPGPTFGPSGGTEMEPPGLTFSPSGGTGTLPSSVAFGRPHAVLLTATSRDDKLWPEADWIALGTALCARGLHCLLPAGTATERERAARIAAALPAATALPAQTLTELATTLAATRLAVGVDTGLVHLAAALGRPTLALFRASDPGLTGVMAGKGGAPAENLGARGAPPAVGTVIARALELSACRA